jgi:hypothetical protein
MAWEEPFHRCTTSEGANCTGRILTAENHATTLQNKHQGTHVSPENIASKSLSPKVGTLIIRAHIVKFDRCRRDHVAYPVVLDVNVLGPLVNWILRELTS